MATKEMKPETNKTQQKQSQQINEDLPSQPLPYKTCSFKVSIHCQGCKRKVKKILTSIEGVYGVDIDVKLHKVTVLGIVSPEILLKKLLKAGKNAELLPEIPDPVQPKPKPVDPTEKTKSKNTKKKEEDTEVIDKASSSGSVEPESDKTGSKDCNKPESEKPDDKPESEKPDDKPESVKTRAKPKPEETETGECGSCNGNENGSVIEEKKDVVKEKASVPADSRVPAMEKKAEESGGAVSGNIGKKKKRKGQNLKTSPTDEPVRTQLLPLPTATNHDRIFNQTDDLQILTNNYPPRHELYPYPAPPSYYAPQVMYGVSYNVAQAPVSVDTASYYTPPPPYLYAYMHNGYQPSDQNAYQPRPSDSFELFSDENPNGCSVM